LYKIPANTLFVGQSLVFMPECHSTNDEALQRIRSGKIPEGTVIVTDNQTKGRGQRSNVWITLPGVNLTFSIILSPSFLPVNNQFYLNMSISLGIADCIQHLIPEKVVRIKWPNDIIIDDKKVCGILIENQLSGQRIQYSVVGIGLNINQTLFEFEKASSLRALSGKTYQLAEVFEKLLEQIEARYLMLRNQHLQKLHADYLSVMYWLGERHIFSDLQNQFEGEIIGVDEIGRLRIQVEGEVKIFSVKEVNFLQ
jgi:BirA family transcriptional regulator, biotin operon repressor / biotin---[acetyl-CoA-carboxylase] ligase